MSVLVTGAAGFIGSHLIETPVRSGHALAHAWSRSSAMPELSRFFGVVIGMFYKEHGVPHFHATYGEHRISVEVGSKSVHGAFPPRLLVHVLEWAEMHEAELLENWSLARQGRPLGRIPPLE